MVIGFQFIMIPATFSEEALLCDVYENASSIGRPPARDRNVRARIVILMLAVLCGCGASAQKRGAPMPKRDIVLVRTDDAGQPIWVRTHSNGHHTSCGSVVATLDGGFAVCSQWADSCKSTDRGRRGVWIFKTDPSGVILWDRCLAPSATREYVSATAMIQLSDETFVIAGPSWMFSISKTGDLLWSRTYEFGESKAMIPCPGGGYVLAGTGPRTHDLPGSAAWILKTDSEGNEQWLKEFQNGVENFVYDATVGSDGRIVVVGEAYDNLRTDFRGSNGWVVITDSIGNLIRNQVYGRALGMRLWNVQAAPDSGFLVVGEVFQHWSGLMTMRIGDTGDSLWIRWQKDGWEEPDSSQVSGEDRLPFGYVDRSIHMQTLHHIWSFVSDKKLVPMYAWLRANGYPGQLIGAAAGRCAGGYYYAGTITRDDQGMR
jgi:hypothetical protein